MNKGFYIVNSSFANPLKDGRSRGWYKKNEITKDSILFVANSSPYYRVYHSEEPRNYILIDGKNDPKSKGAEFMKLLSENSSKIEENVTLATFRASVYHYVRAEEILIYLAKVGRISVEDVNKAVDYFDRENGIERED